MIVRTHKLSDADLLGIIRKLLEIFPDGSATVGLPLGVVRSFKNASDIDGYQLAIDGQAIQNFTVRPGDQILESILFHRGTVDPDYWAQNQNQTGFTGRVQPSAYFDELGFFGIGHHPQGWVSLAEESKLTVAALLASYAAPVEIGSDDSARELSKLASKQIDDLRKLNLDLTKGLAKARQDADVSFAARQAQLEDSFQQRVNQLADKEAELEARREELNDREPQHERRRLREHLTERLQKTIAEPPRTAVGRELLANVLYIAVSAVFIFFSMALTMETDMGGDTGSAAFWARSAKSLVAGIAGAAFAWAGLSGFKSAARAAREYEQQIQRYAFDMDRASWVVETLLQMNSLESTQVPEEWLEAVCRDLFVITSSEAEEPKSLEALAALLDATARARVGTNGFEFELDRKRVKRLAADA